MATRTTDANYKQLVKEAQDHEAFIAKIKAEVSRDVKNLEHKDQVSLFQQLAH